jgi:hypothetical protein
MALTLTDAASSLVYWLQNNANATAIRALIYDGATNVLEAGDLNAEMLATAQTARRTAGETDKALYLTVHDAGEEGDVQHVILRVFDRDRGYRNLRAVRDALIAAIDEDFFLAGVTAGGKRIGFLHWAFVGRTGYRRSVEYAADFEAITYSALLVREEED